MEDNKNYIKRAFDFILYFIIIPYVAVSFCLTRLTNDSRIFLAAEAIADTYYSLPYGFDAAYEVKPVGNRILNWCLYKVANTFVPFIDNNYDWFGMVVKTVALIILIACCWYISTKIKFPYSFPILFLSFACQANFGIMMSEWFAVLFSLVAIAMCMEENKTYTFTAGVIMVGVGLLKSITCLLLIPMMCAVYLLNKKLNISYLIAGCATASVTFFILCLTIWPYSISDMLMSRLVAHVGMYDITTMLQWFWMTQTTTSFPVAMTTYIPGILVGIIAAILLTCIYISKRAYFKISLVVVSWVVPAFIVFIQSEFIVYHYLVLLLPSLISIAVFCMTSKKYMVVILLAMILILPGYVLINSNTGSFSSYEYTFWQQKEQNADSINSQFNLTNQTSLLYLDPGDASYYFHANSSCHYITPMPIERSTDKWNMSHLPQYKETRDCILSYQGEYIVADIRGGRTTGYYGAGILNDRDIMNLISSNYTMVESKSWDIYQKNSF